jgi:hypothetical protein
VLDSLRQDTDITEEHTDAALRFEFVQCDFDLAVAVVCSMCIDCKISKYFEVVNSYPENFIQTFQGAARMKPYRGNSRYFA